LFHIPITDARPEGPQETFVDLHLYNTLTRQKERFVPLDPAAVRMYVCGPTVYDRAHIGNARPVIVFDVLFRLLRHLYGAGAVTYVRNLTDVDDKINARAAERGVSIRTLTEETTTAFHDDVAALGCLPPSVEPRATDHIADMADMIARLVERGVAYVAEDHVLFAVTAMARLPGMPRYGALSGRSLDEMIAGARVEIAPYKRDPMDFVLWKPSKPGEPAWPSPCGIAAPGRPGWHIECSAMAWRHLIKAFETRLTCEDADRNVFDIHGGGIDLVFPHHENEIAQSCCVLEAPLMARTWLHNGFLQVEGEKMSKSAGNFVTIHDLLEDWPGDVIRLAMLQTHYRQPINWTVKGLEEAEKTLTGWLDVVAGGAEARPAPQVLAALNDDLNTPQAIAELHGLKSRSGRKALAGTLAFLGFDGERLGAWRASHAAQPALAESDIMARIDARTAARAARDFAAADRIRDELAALGIALKDSRDPHTGELATTWEVAR
jgi:cysteinyl-tRNA synthetase